jgi:hypothetical protein
MKKFKNNKEVADVWCGMTIEAGVYYEIQPSELIRWQNDSKVLSDIGSGDGVMNNGSEDITDVATAINFLKDEDTTPRDSDGALLARQKVTQIGWNYQIHGVEFKTCQLNSIYSKSHDGSVSGADFGFSTIKVFKDNGSGILVQCSDQADADANGVATQIDWEPTHDIEIVGGMLKQLSPISENIRVWVIGVPDVPVEMGGSKSFVANVNLKFIPVAEGIRVDGKAPKRLVYSAAYHTNKVRLFFRHPAGCKHEMHMIFEFFKP